MFNETHVMTSYENGLWITMDTLSMKQFLTSLALSTIAQCREIANVKNEFDTLETTVNLSHYDELIDKYLTGNHGSVLSNALSQNVDILYRFVQNCINNQNTKSIYLMLEQTGQGFYEWEIILLALDEYTHYMEKKYEILGRKIPDCFIKYNALNDEFRQLMNDEWNGGEE